jgi:hypothetical protein
MTDHLQLLDRDEYQAITATLVEVRAKLTDAGDLLAAMHIDHALQCLDPENPFNQQAAAQA